MSEFALLDVTAHGGWRTTNRHNRKMLGITVMDPKSGLNILELEIDAAAMIDILSNAYSSAPNATLRWHGLDDVGKTHQHMSVSLTCTSMSEFEAVMAQFVGDLQADTHGWMVRSYDQAYNGHCHSSNRYRVSVHRYVDDVNAPIGEYITNLLPEEKPKVTVVEPPKPKVETKPAKAFKARGAK